MPTGKPQGDLATGGMGDPDRPMDRLDSWKEIAAYFKRDIRTVQRWERTEGLPVHRHIHGQQGSVYAYRAQLDAWWNNGRHRFSREDSATDTPQSAPPLSANPQTQGQIAGIQRSDPPPAEQMKEEKRSESAADAGNTLSEASPNPRRRWAAAATGLASIILAVGFGLVLISKSRASAPRIVGYTQLTFDGHPKSGPLLTDGTRFYFLEQDSGGFYSLVSLPIAGGDPVQIPTPFPIGDIFDVNPHGPELLVGTKTEGAKSWGLWSLPIVGGTLRRIGNLEVNQAAWSPEGNRIAYAKGPEVYVAQSDGTQLIKLHTFQGEVGGLSWFPDGKRLRLTVEVPGRESYDFWDISLDGNEPKPVLPSWNRAGRGCWTSGGDNFVFVAESAPEETSKLWSVHQSGSSVWKTPPQPLELWRGEPIEVHSEGLSCQEEKIFLLGRERRPELERYDSRLGEFVPFLGGIPAYWSSFSRDGNQVAYLTLPQHMLWRANADGSNPVQLTFPPLQGDGLALSPDGKRIALRAQMPGKPWRVYLVPSEGGAAEPLTEGTADEGIPSWSPDGKEITFGDVPPVDMKDDGGHAIRVVNVETREVTDLPDSEGLWTSRWSPDGRFIMALTISSGHLQLFDLKARKWQELGTMQVGNPAWSQKGDYIYFDATTQSGVYRLRIADKKLEHILTYEKSLAGYLRCTLAPDDSPLITRELGFSEVYALDVNLP